MGERRPERVAHLVQAELAAQLLRAGDARLREVTITDVRMSPDLRLARVFVRTLGGEATREPVLRSLGRAAHFLRGEIGRALGLRVTPELRFEWDTVPDSAARVDRLLRGETPPDEDEQ
jgi:ribosome-binding factor A